MNRSNRSPCRSSLGGLALALLAAVVASCAHTSPEERIEALRIEALETYKAGNAKDAKSALLEAVVVGKEAGLADSEVMAKTYVTLGAVYQAGLKDKKRAAKNYALGLKLNPKTKVPKALSTPEVEKAFASAKDKAKRNSKAVAKEATSKDTKDSKDTKKEPTAATALAKAEPTKPEKPEKTDTAAPAKAAPAPKPEKPPARDEAVVADKAPEAKPPETTAPIAERASEEPDLPAHIPTPVHCPHVDEAPAEEDLTLRCVVQPGPRPSRVELAYRAPGSEEFTKVKMTRSKRGWYSATVPAAATTGRSLQYYVEAQAAGGKPFGGSGLPESPNLVIVQGGDDARQASDGDGKDGNDSDDPLGDENPLEVQEARRAAAFARSSRRGPGSIFLGFGAGSGYGWHPERTLDRTSTSAAAAGFSPGTYLQLLPEIGYQVSDRYAISIQSRHQFIPDEEVAVAVGVPTSGPPATSAHAVFVRGHLYFGRGALQGLMTGTVGGGQGFRLVIPPVGADLPRTDTIRGGPIVAGPGAGFLYHFGKGFAWGLELRGLVGAPDFAAIAEANTGVQMAF